MAGAGYYWNWAICHGSPRTASGTCGFPGSPQEAPGIQGDGGAVGCEDSAQRAGCECSIRRLCVFLVACPCAIQRGQASVPGSTGSRAAQVLAHSRLHKQRALRSGERLFPEAGRPLRSAPGQAAEAHGRRQELRALGSPWKEPPLSTCCSRAGGTPVGSGGPRPGDGMAGSEAGRACWACCFLGCRQGAALT